MWKNIASALSISLFPLHYFFQHLYYTDTGSTLLVLFAYYQQLRRNPTASALSAAAAIFFRQTNVVWLVFCAGLVVLNNLETLLLHNNQPAKAAADNNQEPRSAAQVTTSTLNAIYQQRAKKHSNLLEILVRTPADAYTFVFGTAAASGTGKDKEGKEKFEWRKYANKVWREDFVGKRLLFADAVRALDTRSLQPFGTAALTFLFFVYANNGLVVGDRANHEPALHLVQLFYFLAFACLFTAHTFLFSYKRTIRPLVQLVNAHLVLINVLAVPLASAIVHHFTHEHPFLLADNRHYTFYLWSRVFKQHEAVRYMFAPLYLAAAYLVYRNLAAAGGGKSIGWLMLYAACLLVGLVPQRLVEFRYFIVPYLVYRLNLREYSKRECAIELLVNAAINAATLYVFVHRTFKWPDSDDTQRFMW